MGWEYDWDKGDREWQCRILVRKTIGRQMEE